MILIVEMKYFNCEYYDRGLWLQCLIGVYHKTNSPHILYEFEATIIDTSTKTTSFTRLVMVWNIILIALLTEFVCRNIKTNSQTGMLLSQHKIEHPGIKQHARL